MDPVRPQLWVGFRVRGVRRRRLGQPQLNRHPTAAFCRLGLRVGQLGNAVQLPDVQHSVEVADFVNKVVQVSRSHGYGAQLWKADALWALFLFSRT